MNEHATTEWSSDSLPPTSPTSATTPDALAAPESAAPDATTPRQRPTRPPRGVRRLTGHRGGAPASDASDAPDDELTSTRKRKRVSRKTDSGLIPALRLNHYVGREYATRKPAVVYDTEHAPRRLRFTRLLMGIVLLGVAWAAALLVAELTESLMDVFPNQPSLTIRFGLYILGAIGLAWLAVVALALIVVGAFSLTLALTRRQW
ncbi:MAG TPA: hypothetical protein VFX31_05870 [Ktedonobacterales bacterium]|jgi:hypothetical protein|nr:hypothetical protein [Ktedonobacterales bacterium]HEX5570891.1 hypothetical protein [Ktedonobacterales bacterium]